MSEGHIRDLDPSIMAMDKRGIRVALIRFIRGIAKANESNQWEMSLEMIESLFIMCNSFIGSLDERLLLDSYLIDVRQKYPKSFSHITALYNELAKLFLKKGGYIF